MPITDEQRRDTADRRRHYIGGSDIQELIADDEFACRLRLWYRKRGIEPDIPFWGNRLTDRGNLFEELAGKVYAEQTGRKVQRAAFREDKEVPYFGCSSDFRIIGQQRGPAPLSIKVPGRVVYYRMKQQEYPSFSYLAQLYWEMGIWHSTWGSFGIFWADGYAMKTWDVDRDTGIIDALRDIAHSFWQTVEFGPQPEKLLPSDKRCVNCGYRIRCHASELQGLLSRGEEKSNDMLAEAEPLVDNLRKLENEQEILEDQIEVARQPLVQLLGERQYAETERRKIFYKVIGGRETFDSRAFLKAHPDMVEEVKKYTKVGAPFRMLRITEKEP